MGRQALLEGQVATQVEESPSAYKGRPTIQISMGEGANGANDHPAQA